MHEYGIGERSLLFVGLTGRKCNPNRFDHWETPRDGIPIPSPRQIVRYAPKAYGFQCHPEFTIASVEMMVRHCAADLAPGTYVQSAEQMLNADLREMNARVAMLLDNFLSISGIAGHEP